MSLVSFMSESMSSESLMFNPLANIVRSIIADANGAMLDPSDMTTMYKDAEGTTPVTAVEQPVGKILDKSGNGNHATQPITASRPTLSARYNLLTKTEDFSDAVWVRDSVSTTTSQYLSPIGTFTANKVTLASGAATTGNDGVGAFASPLITANGSAYTLSLFAKSEGSSYIRFREATNTGQRVKISLIDGSFAGEAGWVPSTFTVSVTPAPNGFFLIQITRSAPTTFSFNIKCGDDVGDGVKGIYVWGIDLRLSANSGPYQRVNTATDYDTDERYFPKYLRFDGVDDYLNLPYMGLYAGGSASVVMGISRAKAGAVKYAIAEGNEAGGKNYIPFRLSDTGVSSRIVNDAGTVVILTPESAGSASSLPEILSFKDTGNTLTLHKNSSQTNLTNYTRAGSLTLNNLTVGAIVQASVTENMLANLYSLIITKSALTDAQRIQCERYAASKAGVIL